MKNLTIIIAMLLFAFTVEAQNTNSNKSREARKTTSTSTTKTENKTNGKAVRSSTKRTSNTKARTTRQPTRSAKTKNNNSQTRPSAVRSSSESRSTTTRTRPATNNKSVNTRTRTTPSNQNSATRNDNSQRKVVNANNAQHRRTNNSHYTPRNTPRQAESRRAYKTNSNYRVNRPHVNVHYNIHPIEYRRVHNPYHEPRMVNIYWNVHMYNNYRSWYPDFDLWYYPYGYKIHTVSAYDVDHYVGEIARVYGRINEVWYSQQSNQYYLYVGAPYPYQDFTIILNWQEARKISRNPERFFENRNVSVTGLISIFEGKPEVLVRKKRQIDIY